LAPFNHNTSVTDDDEGQTDRRRANGRQPYQKLDR